jgi:hypothetical protein
MNGDRPDSVTSIDGQRMLSAVREFEACLRAVVREELASAAAGLRSGLRADVRADLQADLRALRSEIAVLQRDVTELLHRSAPVGTRRLTGTERTALDAERNAAVRQARQAIGGRAAWPDPREGERHG